MLLHTDVAMERRKVVVGMEIEMASDDVDLGLRLEQVRLHATSLYPLQTYPLDLSTTAS
jgi:hypothetical protein